MKNIITATSLFASLLTAGTASAQTVPTWERIRLTASWGLGVGAGLGDLQGPSNLLSNNAGNFAIEAPVFPQLALRASVGSLYHSLGEVRASVDTIGLLAGAGFTFVQPLDFNVALSAGAGARYMVGWTQVKGGSRTFASVEVSGLVPYGELAVNFTTSDNGSIYAGIRADTAFVLPDSPLLLVTGFLGFAYAPF